MRNEYRVKPRVWRMWTPRGRRVFNRLIAYQESEPPSKFWWNMSFLAACWASDLDVEPT